MKDSSVSVLGNQIDDYTKIRSAFFNISTNPLSAPKRFTYTSSDPSVATIDMNGSVIFHGYGLTEITAVSRTGNIRFTQTIRNAKTISNFVGYGQEATHQCWAAGARTLSKNYANKMGINIDTSHSLATDIRAIGINPKEPQSISVAIDLCRYYLGENMPSYSVSPTFDGETLLSKNAVASLINNGTPIYASCLPATGDVGHIFIIYGYYYSGNNLYLRLYDPNANDKSGGTANDITYDNFIQSGYSTKYNTYYWSSYVYIG